MKEYNCISTTSSKRRHGHEGVSLSRAISPRKRDSTSMASEYLVLTDIASNLSTYVQNIKVSSSSSSSSSLTFQGENEKKITRQVVTPSRPRTGTIKDHAKLLLNLKEIALVPETSSPAKKKHSEVISDTLVANEMMISPSLSFEARRHYESQSQPPSSSKGFFNTNNRPATTTATSTNGNFVQANDSSPDSQLQCDSGHTFSLSCPSLSLKNDDNNTYTSTSITRNSIRNSNSNTVPLENKTLSPETTLGPPEAPALGPPELFARPISKRSSLDVTNVAEALASNVMKSFITALEWRTKVWIRDLAKALSSKFSREAAKIQLQNKKKDGQGQDQGNKKKSSKQKSSPRPSSSSTSSSSLSSLDKLRQNFKKSQEARVIEALSQASSSIMVHDVRTTFFVLEQQLNTAPIDSNNSISGKEEKKEDDDDDSTWPSNSFRPLKKRRTVTDESVNVGVVGPTKYTLSHALNLDSRCSVSTSSEEKLSVSLQTPGVIDGTFVRNEDGEIFLVDVSISLDTECLALSMEQKSRLVVRTAAEECIISPPPAVPTAYPLKKAARSITSSDDVSVSGSSCAVSTGEGLHLRRRQFTQKYSNSPFTPQNTQATPHFGIGDKPLVTPNDRDGSTSDGSEGMPPPPPRLPLEGTSRGSLDIRTSFLNPRRVSPTADSNAAKGVSGGLVSSSSDNDIPKSPTPTTPTKVTILAPSSEKASAPAPPLVSPHPTFKDDEGKGNIFINGDGPLLPALLEAASAVHTMCN